MVIAIRSAINIGAYISIRACFRSIVCVYYTLAGTIFTLLATLIVPIEMYSW